MKKPITSAMAAVLACLISSPGMARSDQKAPPAPVEPSRIVETSGGFAICTCASPCSAQSDTSADRDKPPAAIRVGATVRLDPSLIPTSGQSAKVTSHAQ